MGEQIQPRTECKPCRWWASFYDEKLDTYLHICRLKAWRDPRPCDQFDREPGADDE